MAAVRTKTRATIEAAGRVRVLLGIGWDRTEGLVTVRAQAADLLELVEAGDEDANAEAVIVAATVDPATEPLAIAMMKAINEINDRHDGTASERVAAMALAAAKFEAELVAVLRDTRPPYEGDVVTMIRNTFDAGLRIAREYNDDRERKAGS